MPYFIAQSREQISIWWRKHCIKEIKRRYLSGQQNLIRVCKCLRKTIIRKFTGESQHITHSVQHGNINLFLLAPCNASCPRNGQTHVKNLAAFAARFLTFLWPFSKYLSLRGAIVTRSYFIARLREKVSVWFQYCIKQISRKINLVSKIPFTK